LLEIEQLLSKLHVLTQQLQEIDLGLRDEEIAVATLGQHAFCHVSLKARQAALRCLHNILYRIPSTRQVFVELQHPKKTMALIEVCLLLPVPRSSYDYCRIH
jgi:hypothetical protein